jgi:hypothetical protein
MHLLKEIAARSDNFFEAAAIVQDLRGTVHHTFEQAWFPLSFSVCIAMHEARCRVFWPVMRVG